MLVSCAGAQGWDPGESQSCSPGCARLQGEHGAAMGWVWECQAANINLGSWDTPGDAVALAVCLVSWLLAGEPAWDAGIAPACWQRTPSLSVLPSLGFWVLMTA